MAEETGQKRHNANITPTHIESGAGQRDQEYAQYYAKSPVYRADICQHDTPLGGFEMPVIDRLPTETRNPH